MRNSKAKSILSRLALSLVSVLVTVLLVEVVLRIVLPDVRSFSRPDELLGWSYIPHAHFEFEAGENCPGWSRSGRFNNHGFNDEDVEWNKPADVFRILALGDSETEGLRLDVADLWCTRLEDLLNQRGDPVRYEVVNAARSGSGTTLHYLYFKERGYRFDPDLVVLLFNLNDYEDNHVRLGISTAFSPYYELVDGELLLDTSYSSSRDYRMRKALTPVKRSSYLFSLMLKGYKEITARRAHQRRMADSNGSADEHDDLWVSSPAPVWTEALEITQRVMDRLNEEAKAQGCPLVVVGGTHPWQVHPDDIAQTRVDHPHWDLDQPQRFLREILEQHDIPYVDLLTAFRQHAAQTRDPIHGCPENGGLGHWNETGHDIMARTLADFLSTEGLLSTEPGR